MGRATRTELLWAYAIAREEFLKRVNDKFELHPEEWENRRLLSVDLKDQYFGCEIEMTGLTRRQAAEAVASPFHRIKPGMGETESHGIYNAPSLPGYARPANTALSGGNPRGIQTKRLGDQARPGSIPQRAA